MLDDKDLFEDGHALAAYLAYRCPSCRGFRESGCSDCAQYIQISALVESEIRHTVLSGEATPTADWPNMADIHVEVMRRINGL